MCKSVLCVPVFVYVSVYTSTQQLPDLNGQVPNTQQTDKLGDDAMLDDSCNAVIWAIGDIRQGPAGITDNLQTRERPAAFSSREVPRRGERVYCVSAVDVHTQNDLRTQVYIIRRQYMSHCGHSLLMLRWACIDR